MRTVKETNVSRAVKSLRKGHDITIKEMSQVLGISPSAYHNYESGVSVPDINTVFKLCIFYKMNIEIFILLFCQDYAESNNISLDDMYNIYTYDKKEGAENIGIMSKYSSLPAEYKTAVSTFIDAAKICSANPEKK